MMDYKHTVIPMVTSLNSFVDSDLDMFDPCMYR